MINDIRSLNGRNPSLMDEIRFADYFLSYKKQKAQKCAFCFLVEHRGLAVCFGYALHTIGSATVASQQYPPHRSSLKTVRRTVFLTLRPSRVQIPFLSYKKQKAQKCAFCFLVEHRGLEPLTPTLPVWCAPSCANAPCKYILSASALKINRKIYIFKL